MKVRRIAVFGSSSVHGTADSEMGGFVNRLRLWHEAGGERNRVYNLGIWGEDTTALIARVIPEARARKPHLIVLYPGFNDMRRVGSAEVSCAKSIPEFAGLMEALLDAAQSVCQTVVLTGFRFDEARTTPYGDSDWYYLHRDADAYTECLISVCGDKQVPVVNLWEPGFSPSLAADGLHCSAAGHQQIFEKLKVDLRRYLD